MFTPSSAAFIHNPIMNNTFSVTELLPNQKDAIWFLLSSSMQDHEYRQILLVLLVFIELIWPALCKWPLSIVPIHNLKTKLKTSAWKSRVVPICRLIFFAHSKHELYCFDCCFNVSADVASKQLLSYYYSLFEVEIHCQLASVRSCQFSLSIVSRLLNDCTSCVPTCRTTVEHY